MQPNEFSENFAAPGAKAFLMWAASPYTVKSSPSRSSPELLNVDTQSLTKPPLLLFSE